MMNRGGEVLESIPFDVIVEILSRLPAKSVARFRGVSKLWCSMLQRPYFTELFLTRQRARPRLFFAISRNCEWSFYSSPQTPNRYYSRFHIKFPQDMYPYFVGLTSGLIYFSGMRLSKNIGGVVCNPDTGRYAILPNVRPRCRRFLGFDPLDKQFKVLAVLSSSYSHDHKILTLETGKLSWRTIHCPFPHWVINDAQSICISGVLYYLCYSDHEDADAYAYAYAVVCFDVRSETFKYVAAKCSYDKLINLDGKLGGISLNNTQAAVGIELSLWVLKDAEKQEWLNFIYTLWDEDIIVNFKQHNISVVGMTARGEIVLSMKYTSKPFYVFYYNPEKKTLQKVEIQGLGEYHDRTETVSAFVDHVEDLDVIDAKQLKSNQGLKIIMKPPLKRPTSSSAKKPTIKLINQYELLDDLE